MGVLVNGRYYGTEVTDYLTPAEKAAKRFKEQFERDKKEKDIQGQQRMDAFVDPVDTIVKVGKTFADLSKTAKAISQASEAREDKKDKETSAKLERIAYSPQDKEAVQAVLEYKAKEKNALSDQEDFENLLLKLKKNGASEGVLKYLQKAGKAELLRAAKWSGKYVVDRSFADYKDKINESPQIAEKYQNDIGYDPDKVRQDYQKFVIDKLVGLGLPIDLVTHSFVPSINEAADALSGSAALLFKGDSITEDNREFQEGINIAVGELDNNENAVTEFVDGRIKKYATLNKDGSLNVEAGKKLVTSQLILAVFNDEFSYAEFAALKRGLNRGGNPAGKDGTILLSKDQFALIEKAFEDKGTMAIKTLEADRTKLVATTMGGLANGTINDTMKQDAQRRYLALGGKESDANYQLMENTSPAYQTSNYYNSEKNLTDLRRKDGRTKVTDLKILNNKLNDELEKEDKDYQKFRDINGYGKNNSDEWAKKTVNHQTKNTLKSGDLVGDGSPEWVSNFISRKQDEIIWQVFKEGGTKADVDQRLRVELTSLGFYVEPGNTEDPNFGILTANVEGQFPAFEALHFSKAETKVNVETSILEVGSLWKRRPYRNFPGENDKKKLVNSGFAVTNGELVDLLGNFRPGQNGQQGTIKNWTKDILLKSELLGIEPEVLVKGKILALKNAAEKNDKDAAMLLQAYDFDGLLKGLPNSNIKVRQFLEKNKGVIDKTNGGFDSDLLHKFELLGIQNLSQNQLTRLVDLEKSINNLGAKREFTPKQVKDNTIKFYKDNDAKGAVEDFNKRYPQNNITLKDIIWNPKTKKWELKLKDRDLIPTIRQG